MSELVAPVEWQCWKCTLANSAETDVCSMCFASKGLSLQNIKMSEVVAPVEWQCWRCTLANSAETNVCSVCFASKGLPLQNIGISEVVAPVEWQCRRCTLANSAETDVCSMCFASKGIPLQNIKMSEVVAPVQWQCRRCTLANSAKTDVCSMCCASKGFPLQNIKMNKNTSNLDEDSDIIKLRSCFQTYLELVESDDTDLITCLDHFECQICLTECLPGEGITLKDCLHNFCRECLVQAIEHSTETEIQCPYRDDDYLCSSILQEREIKALVSSEVYDKFLARSVTEAEQKIKNSFHCTTVNCRGWCILDDSENLKTFYCPICLQSNCIECKAIHTATSCEDYQLSINQTESERASAAQLGKMLESREAMNCPNCQIMITKIDGCDGMACTVCKTAICWATRGPRWGPLGQGDHSGGCKCMVNGVRCHPSCQNCH